MRKNRCWDKKVRKFNKKLEQYVTNCGCRILDQGVEICQKHVKEMQEYPNRPKSYNTTTDIKTKYFDKFAHLISNQFRHGGDKYKLPGFDDREATDVISQIFGGPHHEDWVLGTMMKYLLRYRNFRREKDLLKIATYCYILWLKAGHHLTEEHDEDITR